MNVNKLTEQQMNIILDNFGRHCLGCKKQMQPLSTRCPNCGIRTPFKKVYENHFIEHFEIAKCDVHDSSFHFCSHPKSDSQMHELMQFCVKCIIQERVSKDVERITKEADEHKFKRSKK